MFINNLRAIMRILLLLLLCLINCENNNLVDSNNINANDINEAVELAPGDSTLIKDFAVKEGHFYQIFVIWKDIEYIVHPIIITNANDSIFEMEVLANEDGYFKAVFNIILKDTTYSDKIDFHYIITENAAIEDDVSGLWYLVEEHVDCNLGLENNYYTLNSIYETIEVQGDSITTTFIDESDNSTEVYMHNQHINSNKLFKLNYAVTDSQITFTYTNDEISEKKVYQKFDDAGDSIKWFNQNDPEVSNDMIGMWYLQSSIEKEYEYINGKLDSTGNIEKYLNLSQSLKVLKITQDSMYVYVSNGEYIEYEIKNVLKQFPMFFKDAYTDDGNLVYEYLDLNNYPPYYWKTELKKETYKSFEGPMPEKFRSIKNGVFETFSSDYSK